MREVCSTVPPLRSMVRVLARVNGTTHSELSAPAAGTMLSSAAQPRRRPMTSLPASSMRPTKPLIAMLRPGTSPPPVRMPMRFAMLPQVEIPGPAGGPRAPALNRSRPAVR